MTGAEDPKRDHTAPGSSRAEHRSRFEAETPPPRILKLALIAAAIIVVIALILYFKARKEPPALHDQLIAPAHQQSAQLPKMHSIRSMA